MSSRCINSLSLLLLTLLLTACVEPQVIVKPAPGHYPNPARTLHQALHHLRQQPAWTAPPALDTYLSVKDDEAFTAAYFQVRYPFLELTSSGVDLFSAQRASLAFFEPQPPFAKGDYAQRIEASQAQSKSLKLALDDADLRFTHDYLGRAQGAERMTGIVHFFPPEQRPINADEQRVHGIFAHYQAAPTATAEADKSAPPPAQTALMRVQSLLFDAEQKMFYYSSATGQPMWLYALAHPTDKNRPLWAGEQKIKIKGVKARGGQCGKSVRDWFVKQQEVDLPQWGYNHLGSGRVRYDKAGTPISLSQNLVFDKERAQNLLFEPAPPLKEKKLKDYKDRVTLLGAQLKPLSRGLDELDIQPDKPYIGASRGAKPLSHTGVVRFYSATERRKDAKNRAVYGEFIHNWNRKRRSGPMNVNAIYYDADSGLFYWKNGEGHKKKMWIYGIAEPTLNPIENEIQTSQK